MCIHEHARQSLCLVLKKKERGKWVRPSVSFITVDQGKPGAGGRKKRQVGRVRRHSLKAGYQRVTAKRPGNPLCFKNGVQCCVSVQYGG